MSVKTDKRDAEKIAKCLAYGTYSPVYVPTQRDEVVKEYIRMRDAHKANLKRIKQQIIALCHRYNKQYTKAEPLDAGASGLVESTALQ
jgi:Transposase.